jgi:PAS domain S-box-containing protein
MNENERRTNNIEARLRRSEEQLRLAEAASGVGTFELDLASGRWEWTAQVSVLFGLGPQRPPSSFTDLERAIFVDDVPKLRAAIDTARRTGIYHVEFRVRHANDSVHWLAGKGQTAPDASTQARWLRGAYYEITDRKVLEVRLLALNETLEARVAERARELAASVTKLQETEHRFRMLVEAVTDYAIYMLDPAGNVVNWNAGAERIKGYARAEIIGQHYSRFFTEADRHKGLPREALATAARTGKYETEGWRVRKDGSTFWANAVLNAIYDEAGLLLGFAKVTRDLTERRAAEERLLQAQKMEAVGQLTGGIAHDFNNLLTVIAGNVEALQRRLPPGADGQLRRLTEAALRGTSRAALLTQRLLAFSRRQPLEPKVISANTLISGLSEMLRRTLGESILIETVLGGGLWPAFADTNQLESALLNLAVNARDAMPGGGKLTIEAANVYLDEKYGALAEVAAGQYVGIFVSDTGTGMTPEVIAKAFDPFFTTKEIGQGTGLGLSQVHGFIKQSGGHIKIYSEAGAGTTVKLYLPRYFPSGTADDTPAATLPIPQATGETILVVEDEADVRSFTVEMLRELGYRVLEAPDGPGALRLLDAHREINLLFTDVGLPGGMNGRQLAEEAQRRRADLKVLFTSGYARNAIVHHGRLDPGVELLLKPFTYRDLAAKMRRVLATELAFLPRPKAPE